MDGPAATRVLSVARRRLARRVALRAVRLPVLALVALAVLPGATSAHAQLVSVDPPDGARLEVPPTAVTLTFDEPVGLATGGLEIIDGSGDVVDAGLDEFAGPTIRQPLPPLTDGWYVASWGVVSEDGHIVRASSVFAVGDADAAARPSAGTDDRALLAGAARALGDLGLVVACGAWAAWWLLAARRPIVRGLASGATIVALVGTATWALAEWLDGGGTWFSTTAASGALGRSVLLVAALLLARHWPGPAALLTGLALLTLAGGGHAVPDPVAMILLWSHLGAAVVWLGAAPAVLFVLRDADVADAEAVDVVRRFSRLAGVVLLIVGAAGFVLAWDLSDGLEGGLLTPWTLLLGAKVACVAGAAALGAWGRQHLGRTERRRLARLFALDASLLVAIALLSATLTLTGPHTGHAGQETIGDPRCAATVGDASVNLVATPGRAGTNKVAVVGVPADVEGVTLLFGHDLIRGGVLTLEAASSSHGWHAVGALPWAGAWDVNVAVRIDTFTEARGACELLIAP